MSKKPVLAETKRKQSNSNKIPGAFNSRPKSSHAIQYAEKSIQHDSSPIKSQTKEKKLAAPKTKLTTRDRSAEFCSFASSRLKSFPAEIIKRIQYSPRPEIAPPGIQQAEQPQQLLSHEIIHGKGDGLFNHFPPPNAISSNNQHHKSQPECHQTRPEVIIPSSYLRSTQTQPHRPFVPRASHPKEPQVTTSLIINPGPVSNLDDFRTEKKEALSECQVREDDKKIDNILKEVESEKHPVGGRSALLHRLKHMTGKKKTESPQTRKISSFPQDQVPSPIKNPEENVPTRYNFPQQNYVENTYPNIYNIQRPADQYMNESMAYFQNQMMNPMLNQNNMIHQHPEHLNIYNKPNYPTNLQSSVPDKNIKSNQRTYQRPQQTHTDGYPPRRPSRTQLKKSNEKVYQYTPAMIHDQELLVTKMRQQGVSEDIMKRQFDALLNEQKRHLTYLQQLEQPEELIEDKKTVRRRIVKLEEEGKPDWMAHITPLQTSHATSERTNQSNMKTSKLKSNKSVRFDDQQKQMEPRGKELYPFSNKNGLQNTNYNFDPNIHQPTEQNVMIRPVDGQQHCSCHYCMANYQNFFIQQHPEGPYGINRYPMQQSVLPHQNFPPWPNNYIINNDPRQYYADGLVNIQHYNEGPEKNIERDFKRNNGLQDEESIKKAMEVLKNQESHKGYEYLANLNKTDKRLVLNGIQDPEDELMKNFPFHQRPTEHVEEVKKELPANGLENRRNPNNPPPPANLHMKNFNKPFREFPRRKDELSTENYYYVPPRNVIDGNLLSIDGKEYQLISPAQNNVYDSKNNSFMAQVNQVQGQTAGPYDYQSGYQLIRSNSMPCDINSHHHQCQGYPPNVQQIKILENQYKNDLKNFNFPSNNNNPLNSHNNISQLNTNELINHNNVSNFPGVYQMIEPRVIGGIKYFARKFDHVPILNNCSYPMGDGKLNDSIICNDKNSNE